MAPWMKYFLMLVTQLLLLQGSLGNAGSEQVACKALTQQPPCQAPPYECPNDNISYLLYTPGSENKPQLIDELDWSPVKLFGVPLKVLIHDYGGGVDDPFNKIVRNAYLKRGGSAVLVVDWSQLASVRCGLQFSEKQLPLVAVCTSQVLSAAIDKFASETVHMVGAGIGAHIAAMAAACLPEGKVGRLTALDPLPPPSDLPVALDNESALLVDAIHTTTLAPGGEGPGDNKPVGHIDVYVNCGAKYQPFCSKNKDPASCSHALAAMYFAESVWSPSSGRYGLWAVPCDNDCRRNLSLPEEPTVNQRVATWQSDVKVLVGEDVPFSHWGVLCLVTGSRPPFGVPRTGPRSSFIDMCWLLTAALAAYATLRYFNHR